MKVESCLRWILRSLIEYLSTTHISIMDIYKVSVTEKYLMKVTHQGMCHCIALNIKKYVITVRNFGLNIQILFII